MAKMTLLKVAEVLIKHELRQRNVIVSRVKSADITKAARRLIRINAKLVKLVKHDIEGS